MNRYHFKTDGKDLSIVFYTKDTARVTYGDPPEESLIVTASPEAVDSHAVETEGEYRVWTDSVTVLIRKDDMSVRFFSSDRQLLRVSAPKFETYEQTRYSGGSLETRSTVDGEKATAVGGETVSAGYSEHARLSFGLCGGTLFGMGSHEEGFPCLNGHFIPMYQENMRIAVPRFVSDAGCAVLIDNTSFMTFDCAEHDAAELYIDCAECVDYYFTAGDFKRVCADYRFLTGETPMPPKAVLGYIQSKCQYEKQDELLEVVSKYRELGVPLDVIVQDWQYWKPGFWGDKNLDTSRFPDMTDCVDRLHKAGAKIMISIWPNLGGDSPNKLEFEKNGMLLGNGSVYNAFDPAAQDCYWRQAKEGLFRHGTDAWWCDCTEPFEVGWGGETRGSLEQRMAMTVGEFKKYIDDRLLNAYSLFHTSGIYRNQRAESDKRVYIMTRSGYAGQHRYGAAVWSGDISATWNTLKRQVHILQNYIATGEAYWNSDVGAFFHDTQAPWFWKGGYNDGCADDGYKELYVRWMQFAGFTPFMRSHGMHISKEIWNFGNPGDTYYEAIKSAIELRYKLMPYLYSVCAAVTKKGEMPVTPLALAFPDDDAARVTFDEYLYGAELLVCPVTDPEIKSMRVYLPRGDWYDFYTHKKYEGGRHTEIAIATDRIPLFARAGAIIPTAPVMQYTDELPDAPYTVLLFPGGNGEFSLYDDNGTDYGYERGEYSLINIARDDASDSVKTEQLGSAAFAHPLRFEKINPA
ncbi:MAG: glycoside hydrolase family 31 protein [Clostridia bacterium]|nr:glycoside hydrolase family 31 protein [Clostridia bacterium]